MGEHDLLSIRGLQFDVDPNQTVVGLRDQCASLFAFPRPEDARAQYLKRPRRQDVIDAEIADLTEVGRVGCWITMTWPSAAKR